MYTNSPASNPDTDAVEIITTHRHETDDHTPAVEMITNRHEEMITHRHEEMIANRHEADGHRVSG